VATQSILTRLRGPGLRALVAWTVVLGLMVQVLLPVAAAQAQAQDPLAVAGAICANHDEAQSAAQPSDDPSLPGDVDHGNCCSICVLLHAAKLAMPVATAPAVVSWPTAARQLDRAGDPTPVAAFASSPYSSRAPPLAA
jgi:hypothetical protein